MVVSEDGHIFIFTHGGSKTWAHYRDEVTRAYIVFAKIHQGVAVVHCAVEVSDFIEPRLIINEYG